MRRAGEKKELTYEDIITGKTSNIRSEIVDYHKLLVEKIVTPRLNTYSDLNYFKSIAQFSENKTQADSDEVLSGSDMLSIDQRREYKARIEEMDKERL